MASTENNLGKNLIFLISQPRAGSTLTQRILGNHPDIHTVSEPWLMLHPLYALRPEGNKAEYQARLARNAVKELLQELPDGEETYFEGIRRMYTYIYEEALANSGKRYFLDKTPRYYFVISELYRVFPEAKFIILLRNPLAVLCSIISTWTGENWFAISIYKHDLIQAPKLLLEGINAFKDKCIVLHYEKLLESPEVEFGNICKNLDIEFTNQILYYNKGDYSKWKYGDAKSIYEKDKPDSQNIDKWTLLLHKPQIWRIVSDYLELLGQDTINQMGYSYEELRQILDRHRPHKFDLWRTLPLSWLLNQPEERRMWERYFIRIIRILQILGFWGTIARSIQKLLGLVHLNHEQLSRNARNS